MRRERELVERAAEERRQLALERGAIERLGVGRLDARAGAPLHELPLDRVERRELVVPAGEGEDLVGDAEKLREKPLEVRREIEQELRLGFRVQRLGVGAPRAEPPGERGVGSLQECDEMSVEPDEAWPAVEILEREAVGELQGQGGARRALSARGAPAFPSRPSTAPRPAARPSCR